VYHGQVVMTWMQMLALRPGIHGLSPHHASSCPTALLSVGSHLRSVSIPKDKVGKVTSEAHADKSLFLNPQYPSPVLCHSLLVGFTLLLSCCLLLPATCSVLEPPQQSCPLVLPCPLLRAGLPQACGSVRASWDAKK